MYKKNMTDLFKQMKTYYYLITGIIITAIGYSMGINDNPLAAVLSFIGTIFLVASFTHRLKKSKSFRILIFSSIGALIVFAILHNVFEALGKGTFLEGIGVFFFLLAIILCPAAIIVGIIGFSIRQKQEEK